jgi:hypothetical protein
MTELMTIAIGSFCGAMGGAMIGTILTWHWQFVTRDEAIVMARQIDAQRKMLNDLLRIVETQCEADMLRMRNIKGVDNER